jgi:hypothetical protein
MPNDRPRQTPPELKWVHVNDLGHLDALAIGVAVVRSFWRRDAKPLRQDAHQVRAVRAVPQERRVVLRQCCVRLQACNLSASPLHVTSKMFENRCRSRSLGRMPFENYF